MVKSMHPSHFIYFLVDFIISFHIYACYEIKTFFLKGNSDSPGLECLNVLGRENINVRQLSEALRKCKLDALNDILFERSG